MNKVLVIVGPTASGKSDLAVHLAKKLNGEIISADSRQVYKGLNVGTGKIKKEEMQGVPHHLLDVADPKKQFTVAQYKALADRALEQIVANSKLPIIVGGTGFYIDALTGATSFPNVPTNKLLRSKLNKLSTEKLFNILKKKDPDRAKTIDSHNKVRLVRALEIVEAIGKVPKVTQGPQQTTHNFIYIGLRPDDLEDRISKRLFKRMPAMVREARRLHEKSLSYKRMHELGLEYRYLALYLTGKLTKKEMVKQLNIAIRQYAKRQMTWFKRNEEIRWFNSSGTKEVISYLQSKNFKL